MPFARLIPALALFFCVDGLAAENTPPRGTAATEPLPAIFAPKTAPKSAPPLPGAAAPNPPRRAISPELAAKLAGAVARAVATTAAASPADVTNTSVGASGDAVKLDPYVVSEAKPRELKERDLLSLKGQLELLHKQSPGMSLEDMRRKQIADLETVLTAGGEVPSREVLRKVKEAQVRNNEWNAQKPGTPFREPK